MENPQEKEKKKVLELWVDEPPEIRLPSPTEKATPKMGGGVEPENIPTRDCTPDNPEEQGQKKQKEKEKEKKEDDKKAPTRKKRL